jgi:hypothetical protein
MESKSSQLVPLNKDKIETAQENQMKNHPDSHMMTLEEAQSVEEDWRAYKAMLAQLLEWATTISSPNFMDKKDIYDLCQKMNKVVLIDYEKFELKADPKFKKRLLLMINGSDSLDIIFGLKPITQKLSDYALSVNSDALTGKSKIACVVMTGRKAVTGPHPNHDSCSDEITIPDCDTNIIKL